MKVNFLNYSRIILCLLSSLSVVACADVEFYTNGGYTSENPVLSSSVEGTEVRFGYERSEQSIKILSNSAWTALSDQKWCVVNPPSNRGDSRLLIAVEENISINPRTANIEVIVNEQLSLTLQVNQHGAPLLSANDIDAGMALDELPLKISAGEEDEWTARVIEGDIWCSLAFLSGTGYSENTINVTTNDEGRARTAVIQVTCGELQETVTVVQRADFDTPEVIYGGESDFKLFWQHVHGAKNYQILAESVEGKTFTDNIAVIDGQIDYEYDLTRLYDISNNFVGKLIVSVKALTKDDNVFSQFGLSEAVHTIFDATSGDGLSEEFPFRISQPRHLQNISITAKDYRYYQQIADIDFAGYDNDNNADNGNFTPISFIKGRYTGKTASGEKSKIINLSIQNRKIVNNDKTAIFAQFGNSDALKSYLGYVVLENINIYTVLSKAGPAPTAALVAYGQNIDIEYCDLISGEVNGKECRRVGGILGDASSGVSISFCSNIATVSANNNVAAICGSGTPVITNCWNGGNVNGFAYVGGIAGAISAPGAIRYCYNIGNILSNGSGSDAPVGGIAGHLQLDNLKIENCFNTGNVSATHATNSGQAGGIVGALKSPKQKVMNCYNTGAVLSAGTGGNSQAGGICGTITKAEKIIENCYNIGSVICGNTTQMGSIGGLAKDASTQVLGGCFFLESGLNGMGSGNSTGAEAKISEDMADMATYTYAGWDTHMWHIVSNGYSYPQIVDMPHVFKTETAR